MTGILKLWDILQKIFFENFFADKGYISKKLTSQLQKIDIQLITKQKKNSKTKSLMDLSDKILIRKHAVIESVNGLMVSLKIYAR